MVARDLRHIFGDTGRELEIWVLLPLTAAQTRLTDTLGVSVTVMAEIGEGETRCLVGDCGWHFEGTKLQCEVELERHRKAFHPWVTPGRMQHRVAADANREALDALDAAIPQREVVQETHMVERPHETLPSLPVGKPVDDEDDAKIGEGTLDAPAPDAKIVEVTLRPKRRKGRPPMYTRPIVSERIREYVKAHGGKVPTLAEYQKAKLPADSVLRRLGWSFADAIEAAGFPRPQSHVNRSHPAGVWTRERVVEVMKADAERLGYAPSVTEWRERKDDGRCSDRYVTKLFGSWNAAVEAAELKPRPTGVTVSKGQQPPVVWQVKVPGTGLKYRTVDEALVAADEIEHDGERVARSARVDGSEARGDAAHDQARSLAEKIREAVRVVDPEAVASPGRDLDPGESGVGSPTSISRPDEATGDDADMHEPSGAEASVEADADMHIPHEPEPTFSDALETAAYEPTLADKIGDAVSTYSTDMLLAGADEWIEKLNAERDRLHAEAQRLVRRAGGVETIIEGLAILRETA